MPKPPLLDTLDWNAVYDSGVDFDTWLVEQENATVKMALPISADDRTTLEANARLSAELSDLERTGIRSTNTIRLLLGLSPLAIDMKLVAAARDHSADMKKHDFFSHQSPLPGKKTPLERAKRFDTSAGAENILVGTVTEYRNGAVEGEADVEPSVNFAKLEVVFVIVKKKEQE